MTSRPIEASVNVCIGYIVDLPQEAVPTRETNFSHITPTCKSQENIHALGNGQFTVSIGIYLAVIGDAVCAQQSF